MYHYCHLAIEQTKGICSIFFINLVNILDLKKVIPGAECPLLSPAAFIGLAAYK
jgi:hypothetical protein